MPRPATIREMRWDDVEQVSQLFTEFERDLLGRKLPRALAETRFPEDRVDELLTEEIRPHNDMFHWVFVAAKNKKVVGAVQTWQEYYQTYPHTKAYSKSEMEIGALIVVPEYRRQGIGTRLVQKCLAEAAKKDDIWVVKAELWPHQRAGRALFTKLGLVPTQTSLYADPKYPRRMQV